MVGVRSRRGSGGIFRLLRGHGPGYRKKPNGFLTLVILVCVVTCSEWAGACTYPSLGTVTRKNGWDRQVQQYRSFVYAMWRALEVEEFLAHGCPRCHRGRDGGIITTMHARTRPQDGAQVDMHERLKFALSRALCGLRVPHDVESGAPFTVTGERDLIMDIVIQPGALANTSSSEYYSWTCLTQTRKHKYTCEMAARPVMQPRPKPPRRESARTTLVRPGTVSFVERSFKLNTLAVESAALERRVTSSSMILRRMQR